MTGLIAGDDVRSFSLSVSPLTPCIQKQVFESSEAVSVISTFDDLGLKPDLLRGVYAYSATSLFLFVPFSHAS